MHGVLSSNSCGRKPSGSSLGGHGVSGGARVGGPLRGYRVLDCTDERGLLAARLLADLGADVVQVEPPGGSAARQVPPRSGASSLYWDTYGANRRGVVCDFGTEEGLADFHRLVAAADFLFESSEPGTF